MTLPAPTRPSTASLVAGFVLSIILCMMNSYLTLSFGVIEEGPTIAALFFFAFCFILRLGVTSDELVIVATMGSAGGSLGFISNFYAAKAMTGQSYTLFEMTAFGTITSLLGLLFVVPLRELLILKENLPWPSSKAVHAVITSLTAEGGGDSRQPWYLLVVSALMIALVVGNTDGGFAWWPDGIEIHLLGLGAFGFGIALSPFAIGGSYLMGMRVCVGFLVGGILLMVMAPSLPTPATPHRYVWPGIGFLLGSGLTMMALNWRLLVDSIASLRRLGGGADDDAIMSSRTLAILAVAVLAIVGTFSLVVLDLNILVVLALVVVAGFIQNIIATRAAAQTAFNPARVMGVLLQGITAALGGTSAGQNLAGAGFVAGSGAQAGNLTGDMVYGRWLKVPARWQFWAQCLTVVPTAFVSAFVFSQIHARTPLQLDGGQLPAPVAKIWAATALIFEGKTQMPPFAVEAMLIAGAIAAVYVVLEEKTPLGKWLPSSTGIGIGLVLPVVYDMAFFTGGFLMWIVMGRWMKVKDITLTTIAVGCIVGEGIGGVIKPLLSMAGIIKG